MPAPPLLLLPAAAILRGREQALLAGDGVAIWVRAPQGQFELAVKVAEDFPPSLNLNDRWVRIYIPETQIGAVHLGTGATITADTYRGKTYRGEVSFIASEAEFTPKNVQTKDERVKLVYAVKIRITGDTTYDLKPGIPADVRLGHAATRR